MTLQTEILSKETSDCLKQIIFPSQLIQCLTCLGYVQTITAGIWCENDVVLTSMRRDDVASTLIRRHFLTKCPLG